MPQRRTIQDYADLYRRTLLDDVVPFWMKHAIDRESGAINNCLDDSGRLISKDRYLWSQGRALWTFSALYNRIEPKEEWLDVAHGIHRYLSHNGRDDQGRWMYRLDEDGNILDRDTSIYVDGFVMSGLGEYFTATGSEGAASLAIETFENVLLRLRTPGSYNIAPYDLPDGMKTLGIPMIFSFFFDNLGKSLGREDIRDVGLSFAKELLRDFHQRDKDVVLEFVGQDGRPWDSPQGRVSIPGHVIEAMWFLISIFEETGDREAVQECCRLVRRHLELGWDEEFGGVRLAIDIDGHDPPAWRQPDCKPWWVQIEALVATAYAYLHTREPWCLEWHEKVREYAFARYQVPTGEWTQWLDRQGNPAQSAALPVKDPFHLPRGLIYLLELFERRTHDKTRENAGPAGR